MDWPGTTPKYTDFKFIDSPVVKIHVGKDENVKELGIHEKLISPRSEVIEKALEEGHSRKFRFPNDDPDVFIMYLEFIYRQVVRNNYVPPINEDKTVTSDLFLKLCRICVVAEKLKDVATTNWIANALKVLGESPTKGKHGARRYCPPLKAIKIIYEGTPENCRSRKAIAGIFSDYEEHKDHHFLANNLARSTDIPVDFYRDLLADIDKLIAQRLRTHPVASVAMSKLLWSRKPHGFCKGRPKANKPSSSGSRSGVADPVDEDETDQDIMEVERPLQDNSQENEDQTPSHFGEDEEDEGVMEVERSPQDKSKENKNQTPSQSGEHEEDAIEADRLVQHDTEGPTQPAPATAPVTPVMRTNPSRRARPKSAMLDHTPWKKRKL